MRPSFLKAATAGRERTRRRTLSDRRPPSGSGGGGRSRESSPRSLAPLALPDTRLALCGLRSSWSYLSVRHGERSEQSRKNEGGEGKEKGKVVIRRAEREGERGEKKRAFSLSDFADLPRARRVDREKKLFFLPKKWRSNNSTTAPASSSATTASSSF